MSERDRESFLFDKLKEKGINILEPHPFNSLSEEEKQEISKQKRELNVPNDGGSNGIKEK